MQNTFAPAAVVKPVRRATGCTWGCVKNALIKARYFDRRHIFVERIID
ncbi:MAG: hypothetical protein KAJ51_08555 [Thermoplasmata archaeon]|nr:hypothetical protein [Thermoplasmata archaeon]